MLREVAEYPNSFIALAPGRERLETWRYTLCLGIEPTVQRQRLTAAEVDEVLAEVRTVARERGYGSVEWEIGSRAEPAGLAEMLIERGLERFGRATALVLSDEPPPAPEGLEARAVASLEEYSAAMTVQFEAFGTASEEIAARLRETEATWDAAQRTMHAVWSDGEVIGAGACSPTPFGLALFGGATRPDRRGRGAYRALIAARWRHAVERGTPALLTQSGPMSFPILTRLGFREVGTVDQLRDRL